VITRSAAAGGGVAVKRVAPVVAPVLSTPFRIAEPVSFRFCRHIAKTIIVRNFCVIVNFFDDIKKQIL
jgi:hypothetical protein